MVKKIFLILFLIISNLSFSQSISASASVDSTIYLVGDYIHYKLQVNYDKSIKIIPPTIQDSLKDVDIIKMSDPVYSEKDGKKTAIFNFTLSKYDSADVAVPAINIFYHVGKDTLNKSGVDTSDVTLKIVQSNPVQFAVRLVKVDLQKDIKDVKEPQKIPLDWEIILLWVLIGLILLAGLFYLYKRYKKKKEGVPIMKKVMKLPSHVIALNSLRALDEKKLWQSGKIKEQKNNNILSVL